MNYAHAAEMLNANPKPALQYWVEAQKRPFQKLMLGFYPTDSLARTLKSYGFDLSVLRGDRKISEGSAITFKSVVYAPEDKWERKALRDMIKDSRDIAVKNIVELNQLGCPTIIVKHDYEVQVENSDQTVEANRIVEANDLYFFMPSHKLNDSYGHREFNRHKRGLPSQPRTLPNFDAKVTFLAYLMRKGYVTEADAPVCENPAAPFSAAMFGFAKVKAQELNL